MQPRTCAAQQPHTVEPWPAFDEQSEAVEHTFVKMTLADYSRAMVCVNACAGVSSALLQALDAGYGQEVEQVFRSLQLQNIEAVNGLDEALEVIGPIEGDDEASELMKTIRKLQRLSEQLKKGLPMKSLEMRRLELIEVLVEDKTAQFVSNGESDIEEVVRKGFVGFELMPWAQLVQCAHDAGIPERSSKVRSLIEGGVA